MDYSKNSNMKKRKAAVSKARKARNRLVTIGFRVIIAAILISVFAIGGVVFGAYMGVLESVQNMQNISHRPTQHSSIVLDMHGNEIHRFLAIENRISVPLEQIPLHLQNAFIAIEDQRFFEHNGVDMRGTLRAVYVTLFSDRTEGGSTITQQLIKNNVMRLQSNTVETKLQEQFLALRLESELTEQLGSREAAKKYILEQYLNTIHLANGLNGVQTAAQFYFNKDVSELTLAESAVIAAITQFPTRYNPVRNPENNRQRQVLILNRMLDQGFITEAEHAEALAEPVFERISEFRISVGDEGTIQNYFIDHLYNVLVEDFIAVGLAATPTDAATLIFSGGLTIETTMDPRIQDILEDAHLNDAFFPGEFEITIEYHLSQRNELTGEITHHEKLGTVFNAEAIEPWVEQARAELLGEHGYVLAERHLYAPQPQSAMVVIDHNTGKVRGIVGGRGEKTTNLGLNRATQSERHPGSVFKMVAAYAPAFDLGLLSPSSILIDRPLVVEEFGGWTPQNWNFRFEGPVSVRRAVAQSMNVVAAQTMLTVGIDTAFQYLLDFGFTTLVDEPDQFGRTDRVPSTAIGGLTYGVTQLEVAAAFGAIANNGLYIRPMMYTRVLGHDGEVLLEASPLERQVISPVAAYLLTSTMIDVITQGTGGGARLNTNMAVAGKTGTSQETRDLNFVGFTPYYTASIWRGHDQPRTLRNHQHAHVRMWAHVMNRIHEDYPIITHFTRPAGALTTPGAGGTAAAATSIVHVQICIDSGLRAVPGLCDVAEGGSRVRTEIFNSAFAPTHSCNVHRSFLIDTNTGLPATGDTPFYRIGTVVLAVDPSDGTIVTDRDYFEYDLGHLEQEPEQNIYDVYELPDMPDFVEPDINEPVYDLPDEFIPPDVTEMPPTMEEDAPPVIIPEAPPPPPEPEPEVLDLPAVPDFVEGMPPPQNP